MMSTTLPPPIRLITIEEYATLPDMGPNELVRGKIVPMNVPSPFHGYFCNELAFQLTQFVREHKLGRVFSNDSGVITERNPDTLRGADVAYWSYQRIPHGPLPKRYVEAVPELVVEVRSSDDRWKDVRHKVSEYLNAGVITVVVIDPEPKKVHVYSADREDEALTGNDVLQLPDVLPGFALPLSQLFADH